MSEKQQPLGICDHCLGPIRPGQWYTSKGKPRQYCCRDCQNTANSRAGAQGRGVKAHQRYLAGLWKNPLAGPLTPAEQADRSRRGRLREVAEGRWRNPALSQEARQKLSRPRKHSGLLADAIDKLNAGSMADLTEEERQAYREYRRRLAKEKKKYSPG